MLLDGRDLRTVDPSALHARTAVVSQDPVLFSASIRENITFGCRRLGSGPGGHASPVEFSLQEVQEAARLAQAHSFIAQKEGGYDAQVGERGS